MNAHATTVDRTARCPIAVAAGFGFLLVLVLARTSLAQGFDSGSDGRHGDYAPEAGAGVVLFDPTDFADVTDNIFHFESITIPTGTTVRLGASLLGEGRPIVWLARGPVVIDGAIDLDGAPGHAYFEPEAVSEAGAGGFGGGRGNLNPGNGPGGGGVAVNSHGGGAGHNGAGEAFGDAAGGPGYGDGFLVPLLGGSGGGGGAYCNNQFAGGGGAGGGALLLASSASIDLAGTIRARGGTGGTRAFNGCGGGGGSGGGIRLVAPEVRGAGLLDVTGGGPPPGGPSVFHRGAPGRIRVEAARKRFTFTATPLQAMRIASPGAVFPRGTPSVRVTRIAGIDAPATPGGDAARPDLSLSVNGETMLEIEASGIPPGTVVRLTINPEDSQARVILSSALAGTLERSTATAAVTLPFGVSRWIVTAAW